MKEDQISEEFYQAIKNHEDTFSYALNLSHHEYVALKSCIANELSHQPNSKIYESILLKLGDGQETIEWLKNVANGCG